LETDGVLVVRSDLAVDLDQSLGEDSDDFTTSESVLETTAEEDGEREGFTKLVGTWRGARGLTKYISII
jgi:hypothetical protein